MKKKQVNKVFKGILGFITLLSFLYLLVNLGSQLRAQEKTETNYYNLAVKKYISNDLDGALVELRNHLKINAEDAKATDLYSLIMSKKQESSKDSSIEVLVKEAVSGENVEKADDYFRRAFKKYLEGSFTDASVYLHKALELYPNFKKADRFLKVIEKRKQGMLEEDSAFIEELLREVQEKELLPKEKAKEKVSADFKDEEISNILRVLSQLYNVNIITGRDIDAKITVGLVDVTLEEALSSILETVGYSYIKEGNIIKVIDKNSYIASKTFNLNNISLINDQVSSESGGATAKDLIEKLEDLLSEDGKLFYDETSRTLMVTDILTKIEMISDLISQIDIFSPQVLIEAKIIELSPTYNEYVGIDWSVLEGYSVSVETPLVEYEHGEDRSSKPEVSLTDTDTTGVITYEHEKTLTQAVEWTLKKTVTGTLSADNFQLIFSALKTNTDARIISSPNILTKGGKEAYITVSTQYPIPSYSYNEDQGTFEVSDFEYKDIGVILTVIPYPVEDDYVSLVVVPEVSQQSGSVTFGGAGGATIPVISTTKVKTETFIKTGHTLAIGGLIKEEKTITEKKVPILGDIPFLKKLFRHKDTGIEKKNIIIFITPTIITKENMDTVTVLQSRKLDSEEYEIKLPEAQEDKPKPSWGRKYERKRRDRR
ncbi:MAG: hypothetical protein ISS45_10455 [Candidatus Omnitrophica bacterium]|nr:hypothetical protein [Candidatus Omnitrophota bacterium]